MSQENLIIIIWMRVGYAIKIILALNLTVYLQFFVGFVCLNLWYGFLLSQP
jgi:hypothetical protein